jgi:hypothetical protein
MSLCTYCHAPLAPETQVGFDLSPLFRGGYRREAFHAADFADVLGVRIILAAPHLLSSIRV